MPVNPNHESSLSSDARMAINAADFKAAAVGSPQSTPIHLVMALAEGPLRPAFKKLGVDDRYFKDLFQIDQFSAYDGEVRQSRELDELVDRSIGAVHRNGRREAGVMDILSGLIQDKSRPIETALFTLAFSEGQLIEEPVTERLWREAVLMQEAKRLSSRGRKSYAA